MRHIFRHLGKKDWLVVLVSTVFIVAQVWLDLKLPDYMTEITTLVNTKGSLMNDILLAGGKMLLCALGSLVTAVIVTVFSALIASDFSFSVRTKLYNRVEGFSMEEINRFSTASLITRSTNDITQVQTIIVFGLQALIKAPIMAVWAISKIAGKSWQWTLSTAIAVVFVCLVLMVCFVFALPKFKRIQGLTDNINRITRENLTGLRVVHAYNAEKYQQDKFEKANEDITQNNLYANRVMAFMQPSMLLVMNGLTVAVYWIGAYLINAAGMMQKITLFSDMVVFSAYAMQVIMAFMMLNMIFIMAPRATVAAKRINEVLDTKPTIKDGSLEQVKTGCEGEIEFKNVSFKYPGSADYVLSDISFSAHKGQTVAIIGSTGCGKTTMVDLIMRFYDVSKGEVLVDGVNVKEYTQEALHNKLGYIPQKAVLFSGTVNTNVAYGSNSKDDYTEEDVRRAVRIAQAQEFVQQMPQGYDSDISQGGSNLSGGQKQRLSIARAICRRPEVLIFDDSFSALDYKTDKTLRNTLKKETSGTTSIIVAQRIGTIKDADLIIVLDDGKIAAMGKHKELLDSCKVYQEIALSQLSQEELSK